MIEVRKPFVDMAAIRGTQQALRDRPELGNVTFTLRGAANGGLSLKAETGSLVQNGQANDSRSGQFSLVSDEPVSLLGTDTGASPAEYVLQALAGCYTVTLASMAAARNIDLAGLELELDFDINLNGFLGLDDQVRKGAQAIRVNVKLIGDPADQLRLKELVRDLPRHSPIHDTLENNVKIIIETI